jgi:hypothetical protein
MPSPPATVVFGQPRRPFTEEELKIFPTSVEVAAWCTDYVQHFVLSSPYFLLSEEALNVLRSIQPEGWQAVPLTVHPHEKNSADSFSKAQYNLVNILVNRNVVNLEASNLKTRILHVGTKYEKSVIELSESHRTVAVKEALVGSTHLWSGADRVLDYVTFVSDDLKNAWCTLGMNPLVFEPCVTV